MILVADNFQYQGRKPLDSRLVVDDTATMVGLSENIIYDGILVYNKKQDKYYSYSSVNPIDVVYGKWKELKADVSAGNADIIEYQQNTAYKKDTLIYLGDSLARATKDFISSNTETDIKLAFDSDCTIGNLQLVSSEAEVAPYVENTFYKQDILVYYGQKIARVVADFTSTTIYPTTQECFDEDIKTGKLSLINTENKEVLNPYTQGNLYGINTLVYLNDLVARVATDFMSDNTAATIKDSWDADLTAGNLVLINKEAEPGILPYKQNQLFHKDKLVFADGRIGRVLKDYISDATAATLEESINIDIHNGNLREMAENYKFKLYKTTQDMSKTVDDINELPFSTIQFENGENIGNMQLNEGVYGPLGTLSLIQEIDVNNQIIKTKTVTSREIEFMPPAPQSYSYTITLRGTGYAANDIIPTSLTNVNAEVLTVDINGEILTVGSTSKETISTNGVGANIEATLKLYVGNNKQWYELPQQVAGSQILEYVQGKEYKEDTLIYFNDILTRALKDFTSNDTLGTIEDSFKADLDNNNLIRMTREDVSVPECLGSVKTDSTADLPSVAIKGNWVLINDCVNAAPGQAGIGLYNGTTWDIIPIPQGTFQFPEPNDDGKLYFRKRDNGDTDGIWEAFSAVDGSEVEITIKQLSDLTDGAVVPKPGELVYDTERGILVIGDGKTNLGGLEAFYGEAITKNDILTAIGFTPEDAANKGQANGYAPLDENGLVPAANLPAALTNTYSKTEVDDKDAATLTSATTLVNNESTRATAAEKVIADDLKAHIDDTAIHVTQTEKDAWNAKVDSSDLQTYDNHIADTTIHVTQDDKDRWDGMQTAYYVTDVADLPKDNNQVGNIGYVQISDDGVTPVVCDQYLWNGTKWEQLDAGQISLSFNWGNLTGKPSSTPLALDNAVTIAHSHNNKTVLDKIGQSAQGNFTYNGVEIGVRVMFLANENLLPTIGQEDTLYVIYEDSRVRHFPSISVYRDGSYQILGRGTQDAAPAVGDMSILQSEYFAVQPNSTYPIHVTSNQFFSFLPIEILREIPGLTDQERVLVDCTQKDGFSYNEDILELKSTGLRINIKEKPTTIDTVSNFYYSHVDIDLSDYKDIDSIE